MPSGVQRVEDEEIDIGVGAGAHRIAAAMGHDAVADLEQHVERAFGSGLAGAPGDDAGDLDAAFEAAADLEEAPTGEAVHVFVHEAREAGELAQLFRGR